jgi:hypothetical protein
MTGHHAVCRLTLHSEAKHHCTLDKEAALPGGLRNSMMILSVVPCHSQLCLQNNRNWDVTATKSK